MYCVPHVLTYSVRTNPGAERGGAQNEDEYRYEYWRREKFSGQFPASPSLTLLTVVSWIEAKRQRKTFFEYIAFLPKARKLLILKKI